MIAIPDYILKELGKHKEAEAVLLSGSRALGKESKNSDWDFYLILNENKPRWRKTYQVGNTWIELLCNDKNQIEKEFKEDLEEGRGVTTFMFATGIIVKDSKNKVLKKLVNKARSNWAKGPNILSKNRVNFIDYDISTYLQDLEDCIYSKNIAPIFSSQALSEFVKYYYRLGGIWMPRAKDRFPDLKKREPKLYNLITKIERQNDWFSKAKILIELVKFIGKKYKLTLSGNLYIPPNKNS